MRLLMGLFCQENHSLFGIVCKKRIKLMKTFFSLLKRPLWDNITVQINSFVCFFKVKVGKMPTKRLTNLFGHIVGAKFQAYKDAEQI